MGVSEPEEVAHIATVGGEYVLSVSAVDAAGQGSYSLTLDTVRSPRPEDHVQLSALSTYAKARVLQSKGKVNAAARKESLVVFGEAFRLAGECGNEYLQSP